MSDRLTTGPGPFFVSSELEFNKNQGNDQTELWEGSEAECKLKRDYFVAAGANRIRIGPKGDGNWQLRATFPYLAGAPEGNLVDTKELEVNAVLQHWTRSDVYRRRFSDYISTSRFSAKAIQTYSAIADCARKFTAGQPPRGAAGTYGFDGTEYGSREQAVEAELLSRLNLIAGLSGSEHTSATNLFYNVAYRGVTGFIEYNQVFRRTVTAGNPQAVRANMTGAGKIWTSAEVIAFEGIGGDDWFDLPPDSQWHKDKPRVLAVFGQKTQLTYSYTQIVTATALFYEAHGSAILVDT